MSQPRPCRATAHSNIALVKYWGKRDGDDPALNLPAVGSLSMTLDVLRSETLVSPAQADGFELDGAQIGGKPAAKVFAHLDRVWRLADLNGARPPCSVRSTNHLPTAAGLASSASGFAALTIAAAGSFGICDQLDGPARAQLSAWARMGSGSAARSLWGGFVRLDAGSRGDGSDCLARQLHGADHWDLKLLVVHTARGAKQVGSTGGMESSRLTSPYYPAWVETSPADLDAAQTSLAARAFEPLGAVMEHSCFKMHACMLATQPPLMYWNGATLEVIRAVWSIREAGGPRGFVTSDAGPHVKVLCESAHAAALAQQLREVAGVHEVQIVAPGPDASLELL
ncbi:Diphosphomevalonate decarboxylase [Enhygromyxa salina]|uniref:diphosphomevalonate decarboxylase n=1 Tax=Enhygromyxa salina TaxID=215803 RepID=A0A0C2D3Z3_9BACT|nr:diphosphomevalonate decarboxylase [Enhygromyxa salina]KIG14817.1 Diphosphomevalonate decarboxylase [Enhygromyxa salina]